MIFIDDLRDCGAPWPGGKACHCWSDSNLDELLDFCIRQLGMQESYLQQSAAPRSITHFDLSPRLRRRAVQLGAAQVINRSPAWLEAIARARAAGLTRVA